MRLHHDSGPVTWVLNIVLSVLLAPFLLILLVFAVLGTRRSKDSHD